MSNQSNNLSTKTGHEITCYFRNFFEMKYFDLIYQNDNNLKEIGLQFHHLFPKCLSSHITTDGVFVTPETHGELHYLLSLAYRDFKPWSSKLQHCTKAFKNISPNCRTIGCPPTKGHTGRKLSPIHKERIRNSCQNNGYRHSAETRAKIGKGIPKPNSKMGEWQRSRKWRHPRANKQDWAKSQLILDSELTSLSKIVREFNLISRRTLQTMFSEFESGWIPKEDLEWQRDFMKI